MKRAFSPAEPLADTHRLEGFDCGSVAQTQWSVRHGLQAHRSGTARVYVVRSLEDEHADRVVGYYALAAGSVAPADAPKRLLQGAGAYHQPVILLTRLGVDQGMQDQGLGRALVADALRRVAATADLVGVRALLIHCENESARAFYQRLARFEASPSDPLHLLLLLKDLRRALDHG